MIVIDKYGSELIEIMKRYGAACAGLDAKELFKLQRDCNRALADKIADHKREMDYLAGEKVEPKTHYAEVVVQGAFGAST